MEILASVFSFLGLASMIAASLVKGKNMKLILFFVCCGNAFVGIAFLLEGKGINGAASCFVGAIVTIINYFFEVKGKAVPKALTLVYAIIFTLVNLIVSGFFIGAEALDVVCGIIAIAATWMFCMCIGQKSGSKYRFWTILNMGLWLIYDVLSGSYSVLVSHILQFLFPIVGKVLFDRKKTDEKDK